MPLGPVILDLSAASQDSLASEDRERLLHPLVGGVIHFARHYQSREQVTRLNAEIHALRTPAFLSRFAHTRGVTFLRRVASEWERVDGTHYAAALAFYSVLSLAPFLLVIIAVAGWMLGSDAATRYLLDQISNVAGRQTAQFIAGLIKSAHPAAFTQGVKALLG